MTTPIKVLLMLVIWGIWSIIAYRGFPLNCCGGGVAGENVQSEANKGGAADAATAAVAGADAKTFQRYPVDFQWLSAKANTNEGFSTFKQSALAGMTDDNIFEITGFYYEAEAAPEGYDNMGFARAASIRELLRAELPDDSRIALKARLIDEKEGVREGYFEGGDFKWLAPEKTAAETVEELDDRIIIRFPYNSTKKTYEPEVDSYLTKLAERVKTSGEKISITGHTDNKGQADYNQKLGQSRADAIKSILVGHGVASDLISTASRGQTQPVATNNTEEGRHENRRAEVRLIKN